MRSYSVRDVERLLRLSPDTTRNLIRAGFVKPARGARREYRFSFQDLIVLRTARALLDAKIPRKRIRRSLQSLRRELPESHAAVGTVDQRGRRSRGGARRRDAAAGRQRPVSARPRRQSGERRAARGRAPASPAAPRRSRPQPADDWFAQALTLESTDPDARARRVSPRGRGGPATTPRPGPTGDACCTRAAATQQAAEVYRRALAQAGPDPLLLFNQGVLLEDLGNPGAALEAYQTALERGPRSRRLPLQPRAAVRIARQAAARHPPPGAVPAPAEQRQPLIAAGARAMKLWVGTSGYNYPEWKGSFYPQKLPAAKMLPYYAAALHHRRDQLHLLPHAEREDPRRLEPRDAGRLSGSRSRRPSASRTSPGSRTAPSCCSTSCRTAATLGTEARRASSFSCRPTSARIWRCSMRFWRSSPQAAARRSSSATPRGWTRRCSRGCGRAISRCAWPTARSSRRRWRSRRATPTSACAMRATRPRTCRRWADMIRASTAACRDVFVYFKHEEAGKGPQFARSCSRHSRRTPLGRPGRRIQPPAGASLRCHGVGGVLVEPPFASIVQISAKTRAKLPPRTFCMTAAE